MTRDQLRLRYVAAINRHWRTSIDRSGPTPALLDELVDIADQHAATTVKAAVLTQARPPSIVVASDAVPQEAATEAPAEPRPVPSPPRTRTRTRRGEPA